MFSEDLNDSKLELQILERHKCSDEGSRVSRHYNGQQRCEPSVAAVVEVAADSD